MQNHQTASDACQAFMDNQERLRHCEKQSIIPAIEIRTDEADWDSYARKILEE